MSPERDPLGVQAAAREAPDAPALLCNGEMLRYGELGEATERIGRALAARGLDGATTVALRATNRADTALVLLALIDRGVPFVPLHPRLSDAEIAPMLEDAAPALVLDDDAVSALSAERGHPAAEPASPSPGDPLAVLFTSGTTGRAKGAVLTRSAFLAAAEASARNLGFEALDRWLLCLPLCHIGGLSILTRCLIARKPLELLPRFVPHLVLDAIERGASLVSVVPTMLRALLAEDRRGALSLPRALLVGGADAPPSLLAECAALRVRALTTYGLTEACSQVTSQRPRDPAVAEPGSGHALHGVELVVGGSSGEPLGAGETGQILVRGPTLMRGYLGQPPLGRAFLATGDLGTLDERGRLHVHARRTDLIVTGGENVYPLEVEQALVALPGVREALVFGVPDETWGQLVAAALVVDPSRDLSGIAAAVRTGLAAHRRPRLVCFVDEIPTGATGKVARAAGRARFLPLLHPLPR